MDVPRNANPHGQTSGRAERIRNRPARSRLIISDRRAELDNQAGEYTPTELLTYKVFLESPAKICSSLLLTDRPAADYNMLIGAKR
jgi:hypothetical protein